MRCHRTFIRPFRREDGRQTRISAREVQFRPLRMKESERGRSKGRVRDEGEGERWKGAGGMEEEVVARERVRKRTRSKGNIASGLDAN